jgi:hypothetical protein
MTSEDHKRGMWAGESNILVVVRCRPMTRKERASGQTDLLRVLDNKVRTVVVLDQWVIGREGEGEVCVVGRAAGARGTKGACVRMSAVCFHVVAALGGAGERVLGPGHG